MSKVKPIPEGYHSLTPHIVVREAAKAIDFYKRAFGAEEFRRSPGPDGKSIMHAVLKIGDSFLILNDEFLDTPCPTRAPQTVGGTATMLHLFVTDVDAVFNRAVADGAKALMPPMDMFWGDRYGQLVDPFGHAWSIATHKEDLTPQEVEQRAAAFFSKMGMGCGKK
jgi:PhnB protein